MLDHERTVSVRKCAATGELEHVAAEKSFVEIDVRTGGDGVIRSMVLLSVHL